MIVQIMRHVAMAMLFRDDRIANNFGTSDDCIGEKQGLGKIVARLASLWWNEGVNMGKSAFVLVAAVAIFAEEVAYASAIGGELLFFP